MQIRTFSSLPMGCLILCGLTPGLAQEPLGMDAPPWSVVTRSPDLLEVPLGLETPWSTRDPAVDGPWTGRSFGAGRALLVKPADALLMGRSPETVPAPGEEKNAEWILDPREKREGQAGPATPGKGDTVSPSELYLQGHLTMKDGIGLEQAGRIEAALDKFREAQKQFDAVHQIAPKWNAAIVEYRRKKTGDEIKRLRKLAAGGIQTAGDPAPDKTSDAPPKAVKRHPDKPTPGAEKQPKPDKKEKKPKPEKSLDRENPELETLRQRLRETEQALQNARRREAGLRTVVRDLLNEMEGATPPPQARRPMVPPLAQPPGKFAPPLHPATPPLAAPVPPVTR